MNDESSPTNPPASCPATIRAVAPGGLGQGGGFAVDDLAQASRPESRIIAAPASSVPPGRGRRRSPSRRSAGGRRARPPQIAGRHPDGERASNRRATCRTAARASTQTSRIEPGQVEHAEGSRPGGRLDGRHVPVTRRVDQDPGVASHRSRQLPERLHKIRRGASRGGRHRRLAARTDGSSSPRDDREGRCRARKSSGAITAKTGTTSHPHPAILARVVQQFVRTRQGGRDCPT